MRRTYYRYFAGLLDAQTRWLNSKAADGLRLVHAGMLTYEFEPCPPDQYQYTVEFVGHKSYANILARKEALEEKGYRVFFKNLNLTAAYGKVYFRPYAEPGGHIGTSGTTLNKELLIIEKEGDAAPFELLSPASERITHLRHMRNPWLCFCMTFLFCGLFLRHPAFFIPAVIFTIPVFLYQREILRLRKSSGIHQ